MKPVELAELLFLTSQGIGVVTLEKLRNLAAQNGIQLDELWDKLSTESYQALLEKARVLSASQLAELIAFQQNFSSVGYWEYLQNQGIGVVKMAELIDQALLYEFRLPPFLLFKAQKKGQPILDTQYIYERMGKVRKTPSVGIVGTRKMTAYGEYATRKLTQELVDGYGASIISGAMVGVDTVAHQVALQRGGFSIGILGFGFDHYYPQYYEQFFREWLDRGMVLLSEYPPWLAPSKGTFVQRNRLIAMLSDTTVVVEAPLKSGALITAHFALEYGKSVGAVPGHIGSEQSQGTHALLQEGAYLVGCTQDVVRELPEPVQAAIQLGRETKKKQHGVAPKEFKLRQTILDLLSHQPYSFEALLPIVLTSAMSLRSELVNLELSGLVCQKAGCWQITAAGYNHLHQPVQ